MVKWCETVEPSLKLEKGYFGDIQWITPEMTGIETPLTVDSSWRIKTWERKSTKMGLLGVIIVLILLSTVTALAVLLYEAKNIQIVKESIAVESVYDKPTAEQMKDPIDVYAMYAGKEYKETSTLTLNSEDHGQGTSGSTKNSGRENVRTSTEITNSTKRNETTSQNKDAIEYDIIPAVFQELVPEGSGMGGLQTTNPIGNLKNNSKSEPDGLTYDDILGLLETDETHPNNSSDDTMIDLTVISWKVDIIINDSHENDNSLENESGIDFSSNSDYMDYVDFPDLSEDEGFLDF